MNEINNNEGEGFSSVDLIYQCLIDSDKFNAFESVLKKNITPESIVLDIGTGSGILALTAGRLGAKSVTAIEFDPVISEIANNNFNQNNLNNIIKIITGDARSINLSNYKFDLIVMELLATGLIDEMQVEAINNLCDQNLINQDTIVIPFAQENYLSLAQTDFELYGFNMKMIKHLWSHDNNKNSFNLLSNKTLINKVVFNIKNNRNVSLQLKFNVIESGNLNSVCLTSRILVDNIGQIILDSTHSLSPIVLIPLKDRKVEIGEEIILQLDYLMGGGFNNFFIKYLN